MNTPAPHFHRNRVDAMLASRDTSNGATFHKPWFKALREKYSELQAQCPFEKGTHESHVWIVMQLDPWLEKNRPKTTR